MIYSPRVMQLALGSILVALVVMALKFVAWWMTGSAALYSDALESIVNVVSAAIAVSAIRLSRKPADEGHPYGHHKAEYFSAVIEGLLIVIAAFFIFREAWAALTQPVPLTHPLAGVLVNAAAGAINMLWATVLIRVGRAEKSPALSADGRHIMTDVVTSAGVLVGLLLALVTGWLVLDALLAIAGGVNVLYEGFKVIRGSVGGLMDTAVDDDEAERIRETILDSAAGAIEVHDIRTRAAGPATFIEFHLVVDGAMTVTESHAICDRIEGALRRAVSGAQVTIHVEPGHKTKEDALSIDPA